MPRWSQDYVEASATHQITRRRADLTPERLFVGPIAVNVDDEGRIIVLEQQQCRIQIYVGERDFVDAPFNL